MNAFVFLVLLITPSSGSSPESDQDAFEFTTCPNRCLMSPLLGELVQQTQGHLNQFFNWYVDGKVSEKIIPEIKPENWEAMCSMWKSFQLCVQNCGDETVMVTMQKWLSDILTQGGVDFACDKEIEETFKCLTKVAESWLPTCEIRCAQYRTASGEAFRTYKEAEAKKNFLGVPPYHKFVTAFSKTVCLYLNCQLKCRAKEILANCGKTGVNATRNGMLALGRMAEVVYIGYSMSDKSGQMAKYSSHCTADQLVHGFEIVDDETEQDVENYFDTLHMEL